MIRAGAIAKESMALFGKENGKATRGHATPDGTQKTKAQTVFLRVPARLAGRIRAIVHRENEQAAQRGEPPALIFGDGEVSLPQWFARAGERELGRAASRVEIADDGAPSGPEPALNVNFDVDSSLAARAIRAIVALNEARAARGEPPVCLRAGRPSLPRWFWRAGLRELHRQGKQGDR